MPEERRACLAARWPDNLTAAERMAVEVLRGGAEAPIGLFVGTAPPARRYADFFPPVRVADPRRALVVIRLPRDTPQWDCEQTSNDFKAVMKRYEEDGRGFVVVASQMMVEVYEAAPGALCGPRCEKQGSGPRGGDRRD